ncbi:3-dehydroquinate synthase II [Mycolicibacterium chitae]|uniref:3-dehydroquinate synthase II n=1 Tax=Mycolicibacterium chitae TaxID=1792 RepID=UPI0021F3B169|nr:hypothetical protein [Mycolicibacterium chitae]
MARPTPRTRRHRQQRHRTQNRRPPPRLRPHRITPRRTELLGPGGTVNNVTELKTGDHLLGYVPTESRHVGLPITEFCDER